jgi:hypothetical protein
VEKAALGNYSYPLCVLFVSVDSFVIILLFSLPLGAGVFFFAVCFSKFFVLLEDSFCWPFFLSSAPPRAEPDVTLRFRLLSTLLFAQQLTN